MRLKERGKAGPKKTRLKTKQWGTEFTPEEITFLEKSYKEAKSLHSTISNSFSRITLVHKEKTERLTFDLNIQFKDNSETKSLTNLVICELKQGATNCSSIFIR